MAQPTVTVPSRWIDDFLDIERLPIEYRETVHAVHLPLVERIATRAKGATGRMIVVGLSGPQGSGKTTLARSLRALLRLRGLATEALSLDDLYLNAADRLRLSQRVHPLFITRGVPGTHNVTRGLSAITALRGSSVCRLPSFDKARDDVRPVERWPLVCGPLDVLLLEGWCVGARPQPVGELSAPVNELERCEDRDGVWRRYSNAALASSYQMLFRLLDMLVYLQPDDFKHVLVWRQEQEQKLRQETVARGGDTSHIMNEAQVERFVSHFERLTRHMMHDLPGRADLVLPCRQH